jgi:hypothetical protein
VLIFKIPCQIKTDQNIVVAHNKMVKTGITKITTNNEDKRQRQQQRRHDPQDYHQEKQLQQRATFRNEGENLILLFSTSKPE